jgi:hypothetical protein
MTAALLAHTGHFVAHGGTGRFVGVALLLLGAALALLRTRRRDS